MRFNTLFGLPAHPLLVHLPIVLLPLVGISAIAMAFSAKVRHRLGWITVVAAGVGLVSVQLAIESGEALEDSVQRSAALREHTSLADSMRPLAFVLFVVVLGLMLIDWWNGRADAETDRRAVPSWLGWFAAAAVVVSSVVTNVQLVRVGHNGAKASWQHTTVQAEGRGDDGDGDRDGG